MLSIFLSLFLGSVLLSGDPNAGTPASQTAETSTQEAEPYGIATVVEIKGQVTAVSKMTGERTLKSGDAIYLEETISTGSGASLQMEVADESLFTISENTTLRMDLFDLDENKNDGHLAADVAKGVFRFVSGKVAKVKPENVEITVPSGTIGIRGTIVIGEIEGEKCLVSLEAEEGDKAQHKIIVSNRSSGKIQQVEITKPGFATVIEGRQSAPKPSFELPQEKRAQFQKNLPPPQFLPRNAEGKPVMNPNVRDPQRFPGPAPRRNEENKAGGPNPPNGPGGGQGPANRDENFNGGQKPDGFKERPPAKMQNSQRGSGPGADGEKKMAGPSTFEPKPQEFGSFRPNPQAQGQFPQQRPQPQNVQLRNNAFKPQVMGGPQGGQGKPGSGLQPRNNPPQKKQ